MDAYIARGGRGCRELSTAGEKRNGSEGVMVWNERIWDTISCHIKGDDIRAAWMDSSHPHALHGRGLHCFCAGYNTFACLLIMGITPCIKEWNE
jgi:hypothetical protein